MPKESASSSQVIPTGRGVRVERSPVGLDAKLAAAKDCDSLLAAKQAGAVDIDSVTEALQLEGHTRRDLSIVNMCATIVRREPPRGGVLITCQSAGNLGGIPVVFNLDEAHPRARKVDDSREPIGEPYFSSGNIIQLLKDEIQPFQAVGMSSRDYVEWKIEAVVVIDGNTQTITLDTMETRFELQDQPLTEIRPERELSTTTATGEHVD
jgi:hypothetical protein